MLTKLAKRNRYLILGTASLMLLVYFSPIWYIHLSAPQYRDGLSMSIWVSKITGGTEFDLRNINLLNHYVGMKKIDASMFPEFKFMPWVLAFMIAGAFVAFLFDRLIMIYLGLLNFATTAVAGLYDFWKWEHDYGHNLDPTAALKVGATFQPPLLACKQLLNFRACSWPHVGTILLLLAGGILVFIAVDEYRHRASRTNQ